MRLLRALSKLIPLGATLLLAACGDVKSPTEPLEAQDGAAFTFAQVQAQIFTPNCAKAGCHTSAAASGGLVLEAGRSYGEIVNRPAVGNASLDRIEPGKGGELQLTDAIELLGKTEKIYGLAFTDGRYDTGNKLDWLRATVELACGREDLGPAFRAWLSDFVKAEGLV